MRFFSLVAVAAACGGHHGSIQNAAPPPEAAEFPALRWVPDHPTYIIAGRDVRRVQRALIDVVESLGLPMDLGESDASTALERLLGVDPLSSDIATKLGIDLGGGIAVFSEGVNPTLVVHLAAPEAAEAYFERLREHARTHDVDGVMLSTKKLDTGVELSWAITDHWLWVHLALGLVKEDPAWFAHAHHDGGHARAADFGWAAHAAPGSLVGFFDGHAIVSSIAAQIPSGVEACMQLVRPIGRVALGVDGDGHHAAARLSVDLGDAARSIAGSVLPPPAGFGSFVATAPVALQWNLDLAALTAAITPCAKLIGSDPSEIMVPGIRSARVAIQTLAEPDHDDGTGVASFDLASKKMFTEALDQIPMRSHLESERTFGALAGHRIKIPFVATVDYVLDDHVGMVAVGDGMLDKLVMGAANPSAPVFAVDLKPPAMAPAAWTWLFERIGMGRTAKSVTERLVHWHDAHIALSIDHDALVLDASGTRR